MLQLWKGIRLAFFNARLKHISMIPKPCCLISAASKSLPAQHLHSKCIYAHSPERLGVCWHAWLELCLGRGAGDASYNCGSKLAAAKWRMRKIKKWKTGTVANRNCLSTPFKISLESIKAGLRCRQAPKALVDDNVQLHITDVLGGSCTCVCEDCANTSAPNINERASPIVAGSHCSSGQRAVIR